MTKKVTLTEKLKEQIRKVVGGDIAFDKIAVYEAVVASTRPISQRNSAYDGAVLTEAYLNQMVEYLAEESVPVQVMHNNEVLPIGKVFSAGVLDVEQGQKDLNALFYVESDSDFANKIDLGIIDEVSIGSLPKHALCSECGFDYAANGNELAFYFRECDKGHVLGENNVHLNLTKMANWSELSLVGKGASDKPKILGTAKQRLSKDSYEKLAASGISPDRVDLTYLHCSATQPPENNEDVDMDLKALTTQISDLSAAKAKLELTKEQVDTQLSAANEQLQSAKDKIVDLETQLAANSDSELSVKLADVEAKLADADRAKEYLAKQVKVACVAADIKLAEDASLDDQIEALEKAQVRLAAIPRGGVLQGSEVDREALDNLTASAQHNSAFSLRNK
jgi:hypothetical protein